jgi:hypothetical protein
MIFLSFSADYTVELWWKFQLLKTYCSWENSILLEKCPDRFFLYQNVPQNYIENSFFFFFFRNEKPDSWENSRFIYNRWSSIECATQICFILTLIFFDFFSSNRTIAAQFTHIYKSELQLFGAIGAKTWK